MAEAESRLRVAKDIVERNHITEGVLGHVEKTWFL